jgi:hypothetical protein
MGNDISSHPSQEADVTTTAPPPSTVGSLRSWAAKLVHANRQPPTATENVIGGGTTILAFLGLGAAGLLAAIVRRRRR